MEVAAASLIAAVAWGALGLQLWLLAGVWSDWLIAIGRFLGYFTILTNLLVAVALTVPLVGLPGARWFTSVSVRTAIATYIAIVGAVYVLVLQELWNPQGAQALADMALHKLVPIAFVLFWLAFVDKRELRWSHVPRWLIYPLVYVGIAVTRGLVTGWYPYPFIDASQLGFGRVLVNVIALIAVFVVASAILIGGSRILARRRAVT